MLAIVDNSGNVITPSTVCSVNNYDSFLFFGSFEKLVEMADFLEVELKGTYLALDSAFDNAPTKSEILFHRMKPAIKPKENQSYSK